MVHLGVSVCLSFVISTPAKNTWNLPFFPPWVQRTRILKPNQRLWRGCSSQPQKSVTSFPFLHQSEGAEQMLKPTAGSQTLWDWSRAFPLPGSKPLPCLPVTTQSHELEPPPGRMIQWIDKVSRTGHPFANFFLPIIFPGNPCTHSSKGHRAGVVWAPRSKGPQEGAMVLGP